MKKLRLLSLFSGIGAPERALDTAGIPFELVAYCEIDKYAAKSYSLLHHVPESMNLGDITKIVPEELPDFDMVFHGSLSLWPAEVKGEKRAVAHGHHCFGIRWRL